MTAPGLPDVAEGFRWRSEADAAWLEGDGEWGSAIFTTRHGGVSAPPFDTLNLGLLTGDDPDRVRENRSVAAGLAGYTPERIAAGHQVHGAELAEHDREPQGHLASKPGTLPQVDGHVLRDGSLAALVLVADCLPMVLAGPEGVAVVHGGWRGIAAGIVEAAAPRVRATEALIGPAIGPCCFEIGPEVRDRFAGSPALSSDGTHLDLAAQAALAARESGVEQIHSTGLCTRCNPIHFFSHRGEGPRTGRQAAIGWFRG